MIQWIVSSSLLLVVLIGLRFLLRGRIKPKLQYALWALALARLVLPISFGSVPISVENTVEKAPLVQEMEIADQVTYFDYHLDGFATGYYTYTPVENNDLQPETPTEIPNEPVTERFTHAEADRLTHLRSAKEILLTVWVGGMILMGVAFLVSNLVFAGRLRKSRKLLEKGKLPIYVTEATETPCLFGLFRPAIYLTPAVAEEEHHRTYAIAHETTHYCHGDFVWSVLRSLCLIVHWYNPLVWWAAILSRADGEIACDEATISDLGEGERAEYGRVLIDLTCRKTTDLLRTATTMTGSAKGLKERIKMIAKRPKMAIYTLIAVLLVAAVAVGCTFTGADKGKDPTDPTTETTAPTDPTKPTEPAKIEERLPDTITGTPLTEQELADFTRMFTEFKEEEHNWYRIILDCEFSRPVDINLNNLFHNGIYPYPELTEADKEFLKTLSWYIPNGGDVKKLPASSMEEVLNNYLGVSLTNVNRNYLDGMDYFADGDCYYCGATDARGASSGTKMIDGKREEDGTVWLMSKFGNRGTWNYDLRIVCIKPQLDNQTAPYRVESCQPLVYMGKPYPNEVDFSNCVPYIYTGAPVTINGQHISGIHEMNYLYAYGKGRISYGPVHSFADDANGHIFFIVRDQSQLIRYSHVGERMEIVYTSGGKIDAVACAGNNKVIIVEGQTTILYDMTTGESIYLPSAEPYDFWEEGNSKYLAFQYMVGGKIDEGDYDGKPYTTEGMQSYYLYAIDDGVTYAISGEPVKVWAKDIDNGYVYFALKSDQRKIWRTDLHGQNRTLVYESQHGDINFLTCDNGWLSMIENYNRASLYHVNTKKLTVLMNVYKITEFSYSADPMQVFWVGKLNKSDEIRDWYLDDQAYMYYLKTDKYVMMHSGTEGIPATSEQ